MKHWCHFVCMILVHWLLTLNRSLLILVVFCVACCWILICSMSAAYNHWCYLVCIISMAADFEEAIISAICFLHWLLTGYWLLLCQQYMCHWCCLTCIISSVLAAGFEQVTDPVFCSLAAFVNWALICSMSKVLATLRLSCGTTLVQWCWLNKSLLETCSWVRY